MSMENTETRVLVVGASAGVGRATAAELAGRGVRVAIAGRRAEIVDQANEMGAVAGFPCDVRREGAGARLVDDAVAALGGLDVVFYAAGVSPLALVKDTTFEQWQAVLESSVVGLATVFAAAAKHLEATRGRVVALSSYSMSDPKAGLVPYAASKAALETLMIGLRREHPAISFSVVAIANTAPTEFTRDFEPEVVAELEPRWRAAGSFSYAPMPIAEVAPRLADIALAPMVYERTVLVGPTANP